ncbi:PAS fold-4 domain protein [Planoprotostelium fungivorum]|uniref:PAS fold-4 domain protein n=1 Tax=Planoprotostelium fungivorum TaxID=1890364 RepID=A0A2P6N832_9EUKA|nr:PAS fold-4 domain protein [Planoprotostelium fungivorum]
MIDTLKKNSRKIHGWIAPVVTPGLLIIALTGVCYRWSRKVFGYEKNEVSWLIELHQTGYLTYPLLYVFFHGIPLIRSFWQKNFVFEMPQTARHLHQKLSSFLFIALGLTALTGVLYRVGKDVFMLEKKYVKWLMVIHQIIYTAFVGIGLISMITSGGVVFVQKQIARYRG